MSVLSPLASLYTILQAVCISAEANADLLRKNEAATRAALIDPVLRALGWDTSDVRMVEPEKTIGSDLRVDYLLHNVTGKPHVVVEAKCLGASLDKHGYVSKVLGYALGFKVQTVFITDGLNWHCYSHLHKGNTESTVFTITKDSLLSAAIQLIALLDAAHSGHSINAAASSVKADTASTKVFEPIKNLSTTHPASAKSHSFIELTQINSLQLAPNQKPEQLKLPDGSIKLIATWKDILVETAKFVLNTNQDISLPLPDKAGKTKALFSVQKPIKGLSTPTTYNGKTIYIGTHYSASDCIANALYVVRIIFDNINQYPISVSF